MAKSKKTKVHKMIDGQLLQMNKTFSNLKMKQKDKITGWVYDEYKRYVTENDRIPNSDADEEIVGVVLEKINDAQIWIPADEIYGYYHRKKPQLQKRLENEKVVKFKTKVVEWFAADESHNLVYTFHNEKQNKDVYMVALRDNGKLIGYYEKHEYRNMETMKPYDLW